MEEAFQRQALELEETIYKNWELGDCLEKLEAAWLVSEPLCAETFSRRRLLLGVTNRFLSSLPLLNRDNNEPQTLGAVGVLPGRQIEGLLRVCDQFTPTLPSG